MSHLPSAPPLDDDNDDPTPPSQPTGWRCQICTFINTIDTTTCSICNAACEESHVLQRAISIIIEEEKNTTAPSRHLLLPYLQTLHAITKTKKRHKFTVLEAKNWLLSSSNHHNVTDLTQAEFKLNELFQQDFIHLHSKSRNKYNLALNDTILQDTDTIRFGRRFNHPTKGTAIRAAPANESSDPGFFSRIGRHIGSAPKQLSIATHLRDSLSSAILCEANHHTLNENENNKDELNISDYQSIDRTARPDFVEEEKNGMVPGLRTIYAPVVFRQIRKLFGITEDAFCSSMLDHPLLTSYQMNQQVMQTIQDDWQ